MAYLTGIGLVRAIGTAVTLFFGLPSMSLTMFYNLLTGGAEVLFVHVEDE